MPADHRPSHPRPRRRLAVALATAATVGATSLTTSAASAQVPSQTARSQAVRSGTVPLQAVRSEPGSGNVVVEWNRTLLSLVEATGLQPATVQPTRDFALMSVAVYDAVEAIDPEHAQYLLHLRAPRGASQTAAAAQAAHDVLTAMFPTFAGALDQQLATDLAAVPANRARAAGVRVGARSASRLLRIRTDDGSDATPPAYVTTGAPGDFRPTPPASAAPVFTHWGAVRPFTLRSGQELRPRPPAALTSRTYAAAVNEVKRLGQDTSRARTPEQTTVAGFWSGPIQNYWNTIAASVSRARHDDLETSARTFALLDLALADATIAMYDAKYAYRLWRPVSAVRGADDDHNPRTAGDPGWTPLSPTPADPSYPGAHSTLSSAAATVLTSLYGHHVPVTVASPLMPGVTRAFDSFHGAAVEAGLSRIYAGVHTRIDHRAGLLLGARVGRYTLRHLRHPGR
jgi:membrane-associated phospholipid phosphatase